MNRNGQITIGAIIVLFVGLIVGLVLLGDAINPQLGTTTLTNEEVNASFNFPLNGTSITLVGRSSSNVVVANVSAPSDVINSNNYTIANNVILADGTLGSTLTSTADSDVGAQAEAVAVVISYTSQPLTYIDDAGSRAVAGLISVFAAIALLVYSIGAVFKERLFEMLGK